MNRSKKNLILLASTAVGIGAAIAIWQLLAQAPQSAAIDVRVPKLSEFAAEGEAAFNHYCAECHGTNAAGGTKGPPLIHDIYNPGHHADASFLLAVIRGVPQHHWRFGDMPPLPHVSETEVTAIIRFVRELQAANGIVGEHGGM